MNPLAEKAIKSAYTCVECITSLDKIQQTSERRKYFLGVINTLWKVQLITIDEYKQLSQDMEKDFPYN